MPWLVIEGEPEWDEGPDDVPDELGWDDVTPWRDPDDDAFLDWADWRLQGEPDEAEVEAA